ncbi:MAG: hypothetical protein OZSIB_0570 [Candidatus Ozemobacter sibiricus]|jgi:hypothetical protein|uniref:DUF3109 family protein n=1 Tax=Candidatus Ozemobacter sibiricus TaxID=2268124 RepID=A0A367ZA17_9BACT|nr:MAG: hypothetical protein OZSIB_0570 [Candidatus Ozemobacter sibiricus]
MHVFHSPQGEVVVSDEVWNKRFACDLPRCQGACCRIGDLGASLLPEEAARLEQLLPRLLPRLPAKNQEFLKGGLTESYRGRLHIREMAPNHPCPLGVVDAQGQLHCTLHALAQELGCSVIVIKPLWCQLYPLVVRDTVTGCLINFIEADFCRTSASAPPILLAFSGILEAALGPSFLDQVREAYRREGVAIPA